MAGLSLAAALALPAALADPAVATDDGEDLSDLLIEDMPGYELAPDGDPFSGGTGPIDWDEVGGGTGGGAGLLPEDMPSYGKSFFQREDPTSVLLVGIDPGDLPASAMVAGFAIGAEHQGGERLTLPGADGASVDYEAFAIPPDGSDTSTYTTAAFVDGEIVVVLYAESVRSETDAEAEALEAELDEFVVAQAKFEPPVDRTPADDRVGQNQNQDQPAADDAGAPQRASDGGDSTTNRRVGLAILWVVLMAGLATLAWYVLQGRRPRPAATGWSAGSASSANAPGRAGSSPMAGGRPPAGPPLPPAAAPPLGPAARGPLPPPPVAPPPIPHGGLRTQRRPATASTPDGWRLPG